MNTDMLGSANYLKVLNSIIKFVSVKVVDYLRDIELPTKMLFHYGSVFEFNSLIYVKSFIPVWADISTLVARMILGHAKAYLGFRVSAYLKAVSANNVKNGLKVATKLLGKNLGSVVDTFLVQTTNLSFYFQTKPSIEVLVHIP